MKNKYIYFLTDMKFRMSIEWKSSMQIVGNDGAPHKLKKESVYSGCHVHMRPI